MVDIRVLGNKETASWLQRQEKALAALGLHCRWSPSAEKMRQAISSDVWMVDADGCEPGALKDVLNKLSANQLKDTPPVVITGKAIAFDTVKQMINTSVRRFIAKPVTPRLLVEVCSDLGLPDTLTGRKALIIEDRQEVIQCIRKSLESWTVEILSATTVQAAFDQIRKHEPDVVAISRCYDSLNLPELVSVIRMTPESSTIPIVVTIEDIGKDEAFDCLRLGSTGLYFSERQELLRTLLKLMRERAPQTTSGGRIYNLLYELEQEHLALNHHAIVSKTDEHGRITEVNSRFCETSKYASHELVGRSHQMLKSGLHSPEFYRHLWTTIARGEVWQGEICNRAKDGELYWVSSTIVPILNGKRRPYKYIAIRKDITHVKRSEKHIELQSQLAKLVSEVSANVLSGHWADAPNTLHEALRPLSQFLSIDHISMEIYQDDYFLEAWREVPLATGQPTTLSLTQGSEVRKGSKNPTEPSLETPLAVNQTVFGSLKFFSPENTLANLFSAGGLTDVLGNVLSHSLTRWVSEYHRDRDRQRLRRAQSFANIGTWEWNLDTNQLYWTDIIPAMFGYPKGDLDTSYDNFIAAVHPDDRQTVKETISTSLKYDRPYRIEHRVLWPDGTIKWLLESGAVVRGQNGEPKRMTGIVEDVTVAHEANSKIARQTRLLNMLHDSLTAFILDGKLGATLDAMLENLLQLTDSTFGCLAEVNASRKGSFTVKAQSILREAGAGGEYHHDDIEAFDFCELASSLGISLTDGEVHTIDHSYFEGPGVREQNGFPVIHTFLKVPIFIGNELVAVFALANRQKGYDTELIELLRPFAATYGVIINSQRLLDMREVNRQSLVMAKRHADQANQAKSEFLSSMSHELRTPLNAILGFGQLLDGEPALDAEQQDNVKEILSAGRHLLTLINEVLDLARVESGKLELSLESIPVESVVEETLTLIKNSADRQGITISVLDISDFHVVADYTRLKQALLNLLSNAVKYNQPNGQITVDARFFADWVEIRISDTGVGIPDNKIQALFQPFNRLGAELLNIEGTGIGLSLTKQLLELMGGSIGVSSIKDKGSTFWARLPAQHKHSNAATASVAPTHALPGELAENRGSKQRSVLHIEDNPANQKLMKRILGQRPGLVLFSAPNAQEGLRLAEDHCPDLILLDINLPDIDGYGVLSELKAQTQLKNQPVVALTASAMREQIQKGKSAGFDDYLTKPINVKKLLATVEKYVGK